MKHILIISLLLTLFACQKGEPMNFDRYMKLDIEAYYEDSSLYSTVSFDGEQVGSDATSTAGGEVFDLLVNPVEIRRPAGDTGRIQVTIIKKNASNLTFDSIINVGNYNDFLLIQLDPQQRPYLLNKRIASATIPQPAEDSVKVRFYFSSRDPNVRNHNYSPSRTVSRVDLELWALQDVNGTLQPVNLNRKLRIEADKLTDQYFSFKKGEQYGWRILDVSSSVASNMRVLETFEYYEEYGAFTRGFMEISDTEKFQTVKIMQTYDNNLFQPGINGKHLFGFN